MCSVLFEGCVEGLGLFMSFCRRKVQSLDFQFLVEIKHQVIHFFGAGHQQPSKGLHLFLGLVFI